MLASAVKVTKLLRKACGLISKLNTIKKKKNNKHHNLPTPKTLADYELWSQGQEM